MMMTNENGIRILTPSDGMYLTNGETYSQKVYLGKNADPDEWREIDRVPDEEEDPELTDSEALAIIVGGDADA